MTYLEPALPLLLLLGVIGLVRSWRRSGRGKRPWLFTTSIIGILLLSTNAFAWVLSRPLEIWYDKDDPLPQGSADAIVILAGGVNPPHPNRPYSYVSQDTYRRLQRGVWLFKHWRPIPILVCGGHLEERELPYSQTMRHVLETEGVPADFIWAEERSRSTHENAVYGSEILRQHGVTRIALVVEANSMPRAAASFRKLGIFVVPAPVRFTELNGDLTDILPGAGPIALSGETVHELVGFLWYRLHGWI